VQLRICTVEIGNNCNPAGLVDENVRFTPLNKIVLPGNAKLVGDVQQLITVVVLVVVELVLVDVLVLVLVLLELVVVVIGTKVVLVLVVVLVGFGTIVISQRSSIQGSGVLHLLTHPTVRRITLLDIMFIE
jgi:hypothetical protein